MALENDSVKEDEEALKEFLADSECLEPLSKWTHRFNAFDAVSCTMRCGFIGKESSSANAWNSLSSNSWIIGCDSSNRMPFTRSLSISASKVWSMSPMMLSAVE